MPGCLTLSKGRNALSEEIVKQVQKHFYIMVFIKSLGSLLTQIGLLHTGEAPIFLVVGWPLFIFVAGNYLVKTQVTAQRAEKLLKALPVFYVILAVSVAMNIVSFLRYTGISL